MSKDEVITQPTNAIFVRRRNEVLIIFCLLVGCLGSFSIFGWPSNMSMVFLVWNGLDSSSSVKETLLSGMTLSGVNNVYALEKAWLDCIEYLVIDRELFCGSSNIFYCFHVWNG